MEKEFIRLYNAMSTANKRSVDYTTFKDLMRQPDYRSTYFVNMRDKIGVTSPAEFNRQILYYQMQEEGKVDMPYKEYSRKLDTDINFTRQLQEETLNNHGVQEWETFQRDFGLNFKTEQDEIEEELFGEFVQLSPLDEKGKKRLEDANKIISSHEKVLQKRQKETYENIFKNNEFYDSGQQFLDENYRQKGMDPGEFFGVSPLQAQWKSDNPEEADIQIPIEQYQFETKAIERQMTDYGNALQYLSDDISSRYPDLRTIMGQYEYAQQKVANKPYSEWTDEDKELYKNAYFAYQSLQNQLSQDPRYQEYQRLEKSASNLVKFSKDYYLDPKTKMAREIAGQNLWEPFKTYDDMDIIPMEYMEDDDKYQVQETEDGKYEVYKRAKSLAETLQEGADAGATVIGLGLNDYGYRFGGTGIRWLGRTLETAARMLEGPHSLINSFIPDFIKFPEPADLLKELYKDDRDKPSPEGPILPQEPRKDVYKKPLDWIVNSASNVSRDLEILVPKMSDETRGAVTKTYTHTDYGKQYQIDLNEKGEILGIYDKDGMRARVDASFAGRLPSSADMLARAKGTQFRWTPIFSNAADVTLDLVTLIAGTKGTGLLLKAGRMRNAVTMLTAQANVIRGQLAGDLIQEGLDAGLTKSEAITYANRVGFGIGAINGLFGISGKLVQGSQFGNVTDYLAKWVGGGSKALTQVGMRGTTPGILAKARLREIGLNVLGENFEELLAEPAWQELMQIMMTDSDQIEFKPAFTGRERDEIIGEGVITTMVSALFGAGTPIDLKEEAMQFIGSRPKKFMEVGKKLGFTEEELNEKRKEVNEELRKRREREMAPSIKDLGIVDPRLTYTFTFDNTADIPKEFRNLGATEISTIEHGSDKKVTFTFTGQQLIDAKLAKEGKLSEAEFNTRNKITELETERSELISKSDELQKPIQEREQIQERLQEIEQELIDEQERLGEIETERGNIEGTPLTPELSTTVQPARQNLATAQQNAQVANGRLQARQNGEFVTPKEGDYIQLNVSLQDLGVDADAVGAASKTAIGYTAVVTKVMPDGTVMVRSDYFNGELPIKAAPNIMTNITGDDVIQAEAQAAQEAVTQAEQQYNEKLAEATQEAQNRRTDQITANNEQRSNADTKIQELNAEREQLNSELSAVPLEDVAEIRRTENRIEELDNEIKELAKQVTPEVVKLDNSVESEMSRQKAQDEVNDILGIQAEGRIAEDVTGDEITEALDPENPKANPLRLQSIARKIANNEELTKREKRLYELFKDDVDNRVSNLPTNKQGRLTESQIEDIEKRYGVAILTPERRGTDIIRQLRKQRLELIKERNRLNRQANEMRRLAPKPEGPTNEARAKSAQVEAARQEALQAEDADEDAINERFDARYKDDVNKGEISLDDAIQAMELANRTESEVYDDLMDARMQGENLVADGTFENLSKLARSTAEGETDFSEDDQRLIDENKQLFDVLTQIENRRQDELAQTSEAANVQFVNNKYDNYVTSFNNQFARPEEAAPINPELEEKQKEIDALNDEIALYNEALQRGPSNAPLEQARRERENATLELGSVNKPTIKKNKHNLKLRNAESLDPFVEMVSDLIPNEQIKDIFKEYLRLVKLLLFGRTFPNSSLSLEFKTDKTVNSGLIPDLKAYNKLDEKTRRQILTIYKKLIKRLNEKDKADFEAYAKERGVQPRDSNVYTLAEVFKLIPLKGQSKAIYKVLKPFVDNFAIPFYIPSSRDEVDLTAEGFFNYGTNVIYVNPEEFFQYLDQLKGNNIDYLEDGQEIIARIFIHELIHGFTVRTIYSVLENQKDPAITENQKKAVLKLQKLYTEFAKDAVNDHNLDKYAISNIYEFVAHLSDEKFTYLLKKRKKGFLEKVYDAITQILGITKSNAEELLGVKNAYDLAVKYVTDIISEMPPGQSFAAPSIITGWQKLRSQQLEEAQRKYSEEKAKYETKINRLYAKIFGTEQAKKDAHHLPSTKLRKIKAEVRKRQAELREQVVTLQAEYNQLLEEARNEMGLDDRVTEFFGREVNEEVAARILEEEQAEIEELMKKMQDQFGDKGVLSEKGLQLLNEGLAEIKKKYNEIKLQEVSKLPKKIQQRLNALTEQITELNGKMREEYEKRGVDPKGFGRTLFGPLIPSVEYTITYSNEASVPKSLMERGANAVKSTRINEEGRFEVVLDGRGLIDAGLATEQQVEIEATRDGNMYKPKNRSELVEALMKAFDLELEEAQANASLMDARAAAWAMRNNKNKSDWYKERLGGIVKNTSDVPTNAKLSNSILLRSTDGSTGSMYLANLRGTVERVRRKPRTLKAWIKDLINQADHATLMDMRLMGMISMDEMWDTYEKLQAQRRLRIVANQDTFDLDQQIGDLRTKLPKEKYVINQEFFEQSEAKLKEVAQDVGYTNSNQITEQQIYYLITQNYLENSNDIRLMDVLELGVPEARVPLIRVAVSKFMDDALNNNYNKAEFYNTLKKVGVPTPIAKRAAEFLDFTVKGNPTYNNYITYYYALQGFLEQSGLADNTSEGSKKERDRILNELDRVTKILEKQYAGEKSEVSIKDRVVETADGQQLMIVEMADGSINFVRPEELGSPQFPEAHHHFLSLGMARQDGQSAVEFSSQMANSIRLSSDMKLYEPTEDDYKDPTAYQTKDGERRAAIVETSDGKVIIHALTNPDVSSPLHELAHEFEADLTADEIKIVERWSKEKFGSIDFREKFARGFEAYVMEGKSPNTSLERVFNRFAVWLQTIYNNVVEYNGQKIRLNRKMRQIYARMMDGNLVPVTNKAIFNLNMGPTLSSFLDRLRLRRKKRVRDDDEETKRIRKIRQEIKKERDEALDALKNRTQEKEELKEIEEERQKIAEQIDANIKKYLNEILTFGERAAIIDVINNLVERVNQITDRIAVLNETINSEVSQEEIDDINNEYDEKLEQAIKAPKESEGQSVENEEQAQEQAQGQPQAQGQRGVPPPPPGAPPTGASPIQMPGDFSGGKPKPSKRMARAAADPRVDDNLRESIKLDKNLNYYPISLKKVEEAARILIEEMILDGMTYEEIFDAAFENYGFADMPVKNESQENIRLRNAHIAMYTIIMDIVWDRVRQSGDITKAVEMQKNIANLRSQKAVAMRAGIENVVPESLFSKALANFDAQFAEDLDKETETGRTLREDIESLMVNHSAEEVTKVIKEILKRKGISIPSIKGSTKNINKGNSLIKGGWDKFTKGGRGQLSAGLLFNQEQIEGLVDIITGLIYKFKGNILKVKEAFGRDVDNYNRSSNTNYDADAIWNFLTSSNKIDIRNIQEQELQDRLLNMQERMKKALEKGEQEAASIASENIYNFILNRLEKITQENPKLGTVEDLIRNRKLTSALARSLRDEIIQKFANLPQEEKALLHNVLDNVFIVISSEYNSNFGQKVRQGAKELGTTLNEVVINHYTQGNQTRGLASKLVQALNLSPDEARQFENQFQLLWTELMSDQKKKILDQRLKETVTVLENRLAKAKADNNYELAGEINKRIKELKKKRKSASERMMEELAMGVLSDQRMADLWFEKYQVTEKNEDFIQEMTDLANELKNAITSREKERIHNKGKYLLAKANKKNKFKLWAMWLQGSAVANLLSGYTSGVRATIGAFSAAAPNLMRDYIVLTNQYITAAVKGRKNEKEALAYIMNELWRGYTTSNPENALISTQEKVKNFLGKYVNDFNYQMRYGIATSRYQDPIGAGFSPLDLQVNEFIENLTKVPVIKTAGDLKKIPETLLIGAYTPLLLGVRLLAAGDMLIKPAIMNFKAAQLARIQLIDNGIDSNDADFLIQLKEKLGRSYQEEIEEQIEEEVAILRSMGKKVPTGYRAARARELRVTRMDPELTEKSLVLAEKALIMHATKAARLSFRINPEDNYLAVFGKLIGMSLFPIVRTPAAFIHQAGAYTIAGFGYGAINLASSDLETKERGKRQLAASIMGGVATLLSLFAMFDWEEDEEGNYNFVVPENWRFRITGAGTTDFVKDEFVDKHYRPFEVQIRPFPEKYPDWVLSFNYVDSPLGVGLYPAGMAYDYAALNYEKENRLSVNIVNSIPLATAEYLTSQSFSRSFNDLVKIIALFVPIDPTRDVEDIQRKRTGTLFRILGEKASIFVPLSGNLYSQSAKAINQITDKPKYILDPQTASGQFGYGLFKRAFYSPLFFHYADESNKKYLVDPLGKPVEDKLIIPQNFLYMNDMIGFIDNWFNEASKLSPAHEMYLSRTGLNVPSQYWFSGDKVAHRGGVYKLTKNEKAELSARVAKLFGTYASDYALKYKYEDIDTASLKKDLDKLRDKAIKEAKDQYLYYGY